MVEGVRGRVKLAMKLAIRFDYGSIVPWVRRADDHLEAVAGPDALSFWSDVKTRGENLTGHHHNPIEPPLPRIGVATPSLRDLR